MGSKLLERVSEGMKKYAATVIVISALLLAVGQLVPNFTNAGAVNAVRTAPTGVEFKGTVDVKYKKPANNVWYECGRLTIPTPGLWRVSYRVMAFSQRFQTDTGTVSAFAHLDPVGVSTVDPDLMTGGRAGGNIYRGIWTLTATKDIVVTDPVTYTLGISESEGNNWSDLQCLGQRSTTLIRAELVG